MYVCLKTNARFQNKEMVDAIEYMFKGTYPSDHGNLSWILFINFINNRHLHDAISSLHRLFQLNKDTHF